MRYEKTPIPAAMECESPFLLVGAERSGTSVLRLLLGHHPEICDCNEFGFSVRMIPEDSRWPPIEEYHHFLELDRGFRMSGYTIDKSLAFPDLVRSFLDQRKAMDNAPIVGATVHIDFDRLPRIWPNAKFIHLIRDPRDTALSTVRSGWTGNTWVGAESWLRAQASWERLRALLPQERYLEVRFEDLIDATEKVLTTICTFLGTTYDPGMLEIEVDTTYQRPKPGVAKSWRESALPQEIRLAEARVGKYLAAAGYEPSGLSSLSVGPLMKLSLRAQNRYRRIRFSQKQYGLRLWAAAVLSRRLPLQAWRERTQLRLDEITNRHLK